MTLVNINTRQVLARNKKMTDCKKTEQTGDFLTIALYKTETALEDKDEVRKDNAFHTTTFTIIKISVFKQNITCFNQ